MTSDTAEELSILSISEDLVPSTIETPSQEVILTFDGLLSPPLVLQTNETECGGKLWPAGMVLAEYLLRNKMAEIEGRKIIELGAGSGLVGLALAIGLKSAGARTTTIHVTDGHPPLLPLLQHNVDLNRPNLRNSTSVVPNLLSWGQSIPPTIASPPDILLAADCCYLESNVPLLVATMEALMGNDTVCYFCYKKRRRADKDMIRKLSKLFEVEEIKGKWERDGVFLYRLEKESQSQAWAKRELDHEQHDCDGTGARKMET